MTAGYRLSSALSAPEQGRFLRPAPPPCPHPHRFPSAAANAKGWKEGGARCFRAGCDFATEGTERGPAEDTEVWSGVGSRFRGGRSFFIHRVPRRGLPESCALPPGARVWVRLPRRRGLRVQAWLARQASPAFATEGTERGAHGGHGGRVRRRVAFPWRPELFCAPRSPPEPSGK